MGKITWAILFVLSIGAAVFFYKRHSSNDEPAKINGLPVPPGAHMIQPGGAPPQPGGDTTTPSSPLSGNIQPQQPFIPPLPPPPQLPQQAQPPAQQNYYEPPQYDPPPPPPQYTEPVEPFNGNPTPFEPPPDGEFVEPPPPPPPPPQAYPDEEFN